jgi:hypothetical protein
VDPDSQVKQARMELTERQELLAYPVDQDLSDFKANQELQASMAALAAQVKLAQLAD